MPLAMFSSFGLVELYFKIIVFCYLCYALLLHFSKLLFVIIFSRKL